jgi:hypothetical protein
MEGFIRGMMALIPWMRLLIHFGRLVASGFMRLHAVGVAVVLAPSLAPVALP